VRRLPARGRYERAEVDAILDEALICHLAFAVDGQPYAIPTIHARDGDRLLLHGSQASRMLRTLRVGVDVCVTATLVDGLVLARSAFHHSLNYRSALVLGRACEIVERAEKDEALALISEHVCPGRWADVRGPSAKELRATSVLSLPIEEASAKVRSGPPVDDDEDLALATWAGVVPLVLAAGEPVPCPQLAPALHEAPGYARGYARRSSGAAGA
jgi:nitroimidazol reductase NimA-like FMN-containing flavoprotein (pyridoxamine 5'-phosphate oxidase superfamily)